MHVPATGKTDVQQ